MIDERRKLMVKSKGLKRTFGVVVATVLTIAMIPVGMFGMGGAQVVKAASLKGTWVLVDENYTMTPQNTSYYSEDILNKNNNIIGYKCQNIDKDYTASNQFLGRKKKSISFKNYSHVRVYGLPYDYNGATNYFTSTIPKTKIKQKGTVSLTLKLWGENIEGFGDSQQLSAKIDESHIDHGYGTGGSIALKDKNDVEFLRVNGNDGFDLVTAKVSAKMPEAYTYGQMKSVYVSWYNAGYEFIYEFRKNPKKATKYTMEAAPEITAIEPDNSTQYVVPRVNPSSDKTRFRYKIGNAKKWQYKSTNIIYLLKGKTIKVQACRLDSYGRYGKWSKTKTFTFS